jgi:DTW domain-containing protein YfiP
MTGSPPTAARPSATPQPRPCCDRCLRPLAVCVCARITVLPTRTRILLLQHARERRVGIGTARMAHLALPSSTLRVGLDFSADPAVRAALADPAPPYVLFPGPGAQPIDQLPRDRPITLVVLDGTWWQARKLLRLNPALAALPRVAFRPRQPSGYLIRRQPADFCLSTIEALAEVLAHLELEGARFSRLLDPFTAMVDRQRRFEREVSAHRHRRSDGPASARARLAAHLTAAWPRLVCVQGEANGWPRGDPARQPPETVQWLAHRPATGETFAATIAPRRPLAPHTPAHVELTAADLGAGISVDAWHRAWQAFTRPDDFLVSWSHFHRDLAIRDGLPLPADTFDLRPAATQVLQRRLRNVADCLAPLHTAVAPLHLPGRGGRRLAALVAAVTAFASPQHRIHLHR